MTPTQIMALARGRLRLTEGLFVVTAVLSAVATPLWGGYGGTTLKALAMLWALVAVLSVWRLPYPAHDPRVAALQQRGHASVAFRRRGLYLVLAVIGGLAGDLLLDHTVGLFLPGLAAFLLGHLAYIACLRQDVSLLPSRRAAVVVYLVALAVYLGLLAGGLSGFIRYPVSVYVTVIATMAAQAIGRAMVLRQPAAVVVAAGSVAFMVSDTLLAIDRFVSPSPALALGVLPTYYLAQCLMVLGLLRSEPPR